MELFFPLDFLFFGLRFLSGTAREKDEKGGEKHFDEFEDGDDGDARQKPQVTPKLGEQILQLHLRRLSDPRQFQIPVSVTNGGETVWHMLVIDSPTWGGVSA